MSFFVNVRFNGKKYFTIKWFIVTCSHRKEPKPTKTMESHKSYIYNIIKEYTNEMLQHELDNDGNPIAVAGEIARDVQDGFIAAMSEHGQKKLGKTQLAKNLIL